MNRIFRDQASIARVGAKAVGLATLDRSEELEWFQAGFRMFGDRRFKAIGAVRMAVLPVHHNHIRRR